MIAATADRGAEKRALVGAGAPVVPYREATSPSELVAALEALDGPVICKTAGSVGRRSPCLSASGTRRGEDNHGPGLSATVETMMAVGGRQ